MSLSADHDHVASRIGDNGGTFNPKWPYRVALIATEILGARARLETEDLERRRREIRDRANG